MEFEKKKVGEVMVVRINQKTLTMHEAPDVKTRLLELITGPDEQILINLKQIEKMDSTGLGALLFGIRQAESHNKDVRFCEIGPKVQFLVKIAHLEDVIDIYDSEEDGIADFLVDYADA